MNILDMKRKLLPMSGYQMGGGGEGGGGGGQQNTSTSYQTNIPEYARPYVETMLAGTQKQLFQTKPTEGGGTEITGFQPYRAYGGTYDEAGNQTSYDPGKGIAGFQPMQTRAQQGVANMQVPGQYGQAMGITGAGIQGALGTAGQGVGLSGLGYEAAGAGDRYAQQATNPYAMQSYMSPYMQNVVDVQQREAQRQADIAGTQRNAQAVGAGAFGGSRQAIMDAEAARNLALQKGDIQATGLQSAYQQAQQAQQYGAGLGLQGLQAGMQGVGAGIGAQQAGYGQAMQGAGQLAGLGQQELAAQQGIYGLQNQMGAQQQALEQQKLNQAMQDYANAQQYPLMQLGTMSNMIRGLPMQASTSNQYMAQPNTLTQAIGAAGTGYGLYNAFAPKGASGGLPSEFKKSGIMSYDVGGEVESDLENMNTESLQRQLKESSSPSIKRMAQRILRERQMEKGPGMAGGGIVAFSKGSKDAVVAPADDEDTRRAQGILMASPRSSGAVTENPTAPPAPTALPQQVVQPTAPATAPANMTEAVQAAPDLTPAMKAAQKQYAADAAIPMEERLAKIQEAKKAAGIEAPGIEQRAKLMAERANAEDEAERTRNLRLAEFFATWGSTPGNTLVAGMASFKEKVPSIISDEKEAKKIRMEIDKSIASLDEATRLEKKGDFEAATAEKNKAAEMAKAINLEIIKIQEEEAKAKRADKRAEEKDIRQGQREEAKDIRYAGLQKDIAQMKIDSDERLKKIDATWRNADKANQNTDRLVALYRGAQSDIATVESRISNIMKSEEYQRALADAGQKIDENTSEAAKKIQANAAQALKEFNTSFKTQRDAVDKTVNFMEERLKTRGVELPARKQVSNAAPPPPPGAKLD